MVTCRSTGSTAPGILGAAVPARRDPSGVRHAATHRLAVLGVTDALDADRLAAVAGAAQLADDLARAEAVDALSDQRRPPAVDAARGPVAHRARALAQERPLELALPDAEDGSEHGRGFAAPPSSPSRRTRPPARRPARGRPRTTAFWRVASVLRRPWRHLTSGAAEPLQTPERSHGKAIFATRRC